MDATFRIRFRSPSNEMLGRADLKKEINFVPPTGMEVQGGPWDDGERIEVLSVDYNIFHDDFVIELGPAIEVNKSDLSKYAEVIRPTDWTWIGPIANE